MERCVSNGNHDFDKLSNDCTELLFIFNDVINTLSTNDGTFGYKVIYNFVFRQLEHWFFLFIQSENGEKESFIHTQTTFKRLLFQISLKLFHEKYITDENNVILLTCYLCKIILHKIKKNKIPTLINFNQWRHVIMT